MSYTARSTDLRKLTSIGAFLAFTVLSVGSTALAAASVGDAPEDSALIEADEAVAGARGIEAEAQKFTYESTKEKERAKAATASAASAKASAARNERDAKIEIAKAEVEIQAYRLTQKRAKVEENAADRAYAKSSADMERWRAEIEKAMRLSEAAQMRASKALARADAAQAEATRLAHRASLVRGIAAQTVVPTLSPVSAPTARAAAPQPLSLARDCNMRAEPNVDGPVVLQVMKGSSVVADTSSTGGGQKWIRAALGDRSASGYIAGSCFKR